MWLWILAFLSSETPLLGSLSGITTRERFSANLFIQAMLGHAELSTTEIYTRVSIRKLKEVRTATHPAARLARKPADSFPPLEAEEEK